jgi:hypothetical protein
LGIANTLASGLTGTDATTRAIGNQHVGFVVNTLTGTGTLTITGDSASEASSIPVIGNTEEITVDATGAYQSDLKWWRITNVAVAGVGAINYDVRQIGYWDNGNSDFRLVGYRLEVTPTSDTAIDLTFHVHKIQDDGAKKMTLVSLEDIQLSGTTPFIDDNLRLAANNRDYTGGVITRVGLPTVLKQTDFETFFVADENIFESGTKAEGVVIELPAWDSVDFITGFLYYKNGTGL